MKQAALPIVALVLFAAGESMPSDLSWLRALSEMTSFGIFVWFCWYGLTRSFPKMLKTHKEIEESNRQAFKDEWDACRKHHQEIESNSHQAFKQESDASRKHQGDIVSKVMERHREDIKEVTNELKNMRTEIGSCSVKGQD